MFSPNRGLLDFSTITSILIILIYSLNCLRKKTIPFSINFKMILPLLILLFYTGLLILFTQSNHLYYMIFFLRLIIIYLGLNFLIETTKLKPKTFLLALFFSLSVNSIITLVQYFDFLGFGGLLLNLNNNFIDYALREYRVMGLLSGYDANGITIAITFLIGWIARDNILNRINRLLFNLLLLITLFSLFFASRTGIVTVILGLLIIFLLKNRKSLIKIIKVFVISIASIILVFSIIISLEEYIPAEYSETYYFIFEPLIHFNKYGQFETISTNDLLENHYTELSTNQFELLFGSSYSNSSKLGGYSDVGYIQIINGLGILGLLLTLYLYASWTYLVVRKVNCEKEKSLISIIILQLALGISIIVLNFKGPYFFADTIFYIYLIVSLYIYKKFN